MKRCYLLALLVCLSVTTLFAQDSCERTYYNETLTAGIEESILFWADLQADWREEVVTALPGEIRIYRSNIPAADRRVTLMQDALYRSYVAHRSMGYPQAPVTSYYLGE